MNNLSAQSTPIAGVWRIDRRLHADTRGLFARLFDAGELAQFGWSGPVAQVNHSVTRQQGSVRGLHFQYSPDAEAKLISCTRGRIFDVAVDLRAGSPTFLRWHGEILSAADGGALLLPEGCAHGFQTLSDDVELLYCHSRPYAGAAEGGINPFDPRIGVAWPDHATEVSDRDRNQPMLDAQFHGVEI